MYEFQVPEHFKLQTLPSLILLSARARALLRARHSFLHWHAPAKSRESYSPAHRPQVTPRRIMTNQIWAYLGDKGATLDRNQSDWSRAGPVAGV